MGSKNKAESMLNKASFGNGFGLIFVNLPSKSSLKLMGSTGFDSRTHEKVSKSSAELQLVNLIFHIFKWRE